MIEVKNLTCGYEGGFLLKDISFEVGGGELIGIIGPNGSGKSTLLRAMSKILKPMKGAVFLKGEDMGRMSFSKLAKRIAVTSQSSSLRELDITVREYVMLGRIPYKRRFQFVETGADEKKAVQAMARLDISTLAERNVGQLSGGEAQRAVIARALAQEPEFLLLDEPTVHLDIGHRIEILDMIRELNRAHSLAIVMVLHDLNLASLYCDRLILLSDGEIYRNGAPEEILTYSVIEKVYGTMVVVRENPLFPKKPFVYLVPKGLRKKIGI